MRNLFIGILCFLLIFSTEIDFDFMTNSDAIRPAVLACLLLLSFVFFAKNFKIPKLNSLAYKFLLAYLFYLFFNMILSIPYEGKINSIVGIYSCFLFSLFFYKNFEYSTIVKSVSYSVFIVSFLGVILFFVSPAFALNHEEFFRFKGLFNHSQRFSLILATGLIILVVDRYKRKLEFFDYLKFIILFVLLLLTKTRANTTFVILIFLIDYFRNVNKIFLILFSIIFFISFIYFDLLDNFTNIYSRDSADVTELTGRTKLWELLMPEIASNLLIGHGFGLFKTGPIPVFSWTPTHAHNLWLMQLYETGIIGTLLFSLFLIYSFSIAIKHKNIFGYSYLYYLIIFIFLSSLTGLIIGGLATPLYFIFFIFLFKEIDRVYGIS
ncbi:O-antigen ligase family protein [Algoriphagus halophytocola]|uniref:O-antigen ligase family protein n=1 Tax=Algoriphagus halophytocola TaxID=2991499 RepID=UPI0022DDF086|nr:O-antigen ligase family protein [Algoriphagus sp. TR-M9]WBL41238.1 O-antigen ligase family protein [Algoriphagus sp. TR-M9]